MGRKNHNSHGDSHRRGWLDGDAKWKAKIRLITLAVWIVGAALAGSGLYLLFSDGRTFTKVIGSVIFLAGALLIGFSRDLRDWIFTKW
jgi:hypothetical protein